jgi:hypothetical protein
MTDLPLNDLHMAIAHAEYEGFDDIDYETRDWKHYRDTGEDKRIKSKRRPTPRDFEVFAMFVQTWGSTALGHGGIGGSAMTPAYTIVLRMHRQFLVYFGGRLCYIVNDPSDSFFEDVKNHCLASKRDCNKYE